MKPYYSHKGITIYHGDCLEVMPGLEPVDLVLTDPPYSTPVITSFGRKLERHYGDLSIQKGFFRLFRDTLKLKEQAPVFICCDHKYYPILFEVFYEWLTHQLIVWDKERIGLGSPFRNQYELIYFVSKEYGLHFRKEKWLSNLIKCKPVKTKKKIHGAQKPTELFKKLIDSFNGSLILDPFMGSGTTLVVAKELTRKAIGIEIEEKYCEIAAKRLQQEVLFGIPNDKIEVTECL